MKENTPLVHQDTIQVLLSEQRQREVLRKITIYLIPWLAILYLMAVLDRANLSNVQLDLVIKDTFNNVTECVNVTSMLNCTTTLTVSQTGIITNAEYGLAVSVFFIGYLVFEVPSNIALKKTSAPTWLARIMISWGIVTICTMFVKDATGLIICRFILGAAEAGFFPGVLYYLSTWFTPQDRAVRIGLFYLTSPVSGVVGGILSYGILQMNGIGGLTGWQWLFLLEGIPSVILGVMTWFILPDRPDNCTFLDSDEKAWVVQSLQQQQRDADSDPQGVSIREMIEVFKSWRVWLFCLLSLGNNTMGAVVSFFIPSIINQFGFDKLTSNLLSAPPFFCGVLCILANSYHSDLTKERPLHLLIPFGLQIVGWALVAVSFFYSTPLAVQYCVLSFTVGVHYTFPPIFWAWLTQELKGGTTVAISTAFVASFGTFAQIFTPPLTTFIVEKTGSYMYVAASLSAFGVFGMLIGILLLFLLRWYPQQYVKVDDEVKLSKKK